jgi:hypothetical protein
MFHVLLLSEAATLRDKADQNLKFLDDFIDSIIVMLFHAALAVDSLNLLLFHEGLKLVRARVRFGNMECFDRCHLKEGLIDIHEGALKGRTSINERVGKVLTSAIVHLEPYIPLPKAEDFPN